MDAKIISDLIPSGVYTGQIHLRPGIVGVKTTNAYIKLGSQWVQIATTNVYPFAYKNVTLLINGIDRTGLLQKDTLTISSILDNEIDTCEFELLDVTQSFIPHEGQEIDIFKNVAGTITKIYSGKINGIAQNPIKKNASYTISCVDFTDDLRRKTHIGVYENKTCGYIIRDVIANCCKTIGTYYVEEGETVTITFNYQYPADIIQQLAEATGYNWYVDYDKNLHFYLPETNVAPYSLLETSGSGQFRDLTITIDKSQLKNSQVIRGGYELTGSVYTQLKEADGIQTSFKLDYTPYVPITVEVDTGAGYVSHTLGIDNIDTSGKDFVVNVSENVVKNLDHATLSVGDKIRIKYKYKKIIFKQIRSKKSIELMKQYEGGNGIYEGEIIVDETLDTSESVRLRGEAEILKYSNPIISGNFYTVQSGYQVGQILTINLPTRGYINQQYLIREVTFTSLGNGNFEYNVIFATKLKGLEEFLIEIFKQTRKQFARADDILDRFDIFEEDPITVDDSDGVIISEQRNIINHPFLWCNDAGTTTDSGRWDLAEWGSDD